MLLVANFCMPLGDKNVWGTLYPIKKKKKVVMLATKVNELWNTNLIQLNLDYLNSGGLGRNVHVTESLDYQKYEYQ